MNEPLVFLPGHMCDGRLFAHQVEAFSSERAVHLANFKLGATIAEFAANALASAPPRFVLCGLSMGGIVAMEILRTSAERIAGLVLMDTNYRAESHERAKARKRTIALVERGELALESVIRDEMKPAYLADGPRNKPILDLVMAMAMSLGSQVFGRQARAIMSRPDQAETLRRAAVPALVICGEEDKLCTLQTHEDMVGLIPGAKLEVVRGAGHLVPLEQPERTNELISEWLERAL